MEGQMSLEDFNGVRSDLIDELNQVVAAAGTSEAVAIFGTARKGDLNQLILLQDDTIENLFGTVPRDSSFDTNLPRAYYEISRCTTNGLLAYGCRVGDARVATLHQYESQASYTGTGQYEQDRIASGDYAYQRDPITDSLAYSLIHEAREPGSDPNAGRVVVKDNQGIPYTLTYFLPDGTTRTFALDPFGKIPNALRNVREVANALNNDPNWSQMYITRYPMIRKTDVELTVAEDSNGIRYIEIDSNANDSKGDKLETLEQIAQMVNNNSETIPFGVTSFRLTNRPIKDTEAATRTIDRFVRYIKDELVLRVDASMVGGDTHIGSLSIVSSSMKWDRNLATLFTTDSSSEYFNNARLFVRRAGSATKTEVPKVNSTNQPIWTIDSDGQITITLANWTNNTQFIMGDEYTIDLRYGATYTESETRSGLDSGNEFSYFIKGFEIIFGSATTVEVTAVYQTRKVFMPAEVNLLDRENIIIQFVNGANRPAVGSTVLVTYTHLPELPASSGAILQRPGGSTLVQPTGFSGGDDGRLISKSRYKELVLDAMSLLELYPFRQIFVSGAYIVDVEQGFDDETGEEALIPINWAPDLIAKLSRRSNLVKECIMDLPVRPPAETTPVAINRWLDSLITLDDSVPGRPANMIEGAKAPGSFRLSAPAGAPVFLIPKVNGSSRYIGNPASVTTAMRQELPLERSMINQILPPAVLDLAVRPFNAEIIGNLNQRGWTFMTVDSRNNRVIADAPTLGLTGSMFQRQFVLAATIAMIEIARATAERFIGLRRSEGNLIAMKNKIQKNLNYLVPSVFSQIDVAIVDVPNGAITGRTKVKLTAITSVEIRRVDVETRISLA
jgi:hypothetical protein